MKKLTVDQFHRSVDFIMTYSRPIDQHLYSYYFNNGSQEQVLDTLSTYQNKDGGIGHGIEPDIRTPESSPIATTFAMQYARMVNAPWDHPFVESCMNYFTNTFNKYHNWPIRLPHMNEHPHADWWGFTSYEKKFCVNPGVEIIGYYHAYPQYIPEELFPLFHDYIFQHIEDNPEGIEFHELLCYLRLTEAIPDPGKSNIIDYLRDICRHVASLNPNEWSGYGAKPLSLAPSPKSPLANALADVIQLNLDFEIDNQQTDGSWLPNWKWGNYLDTWKNQVLNEWKGYITVINLKTLHDYDRIEKI